MKLDNNDFGQIIKHTPLLSIDLIVRSRDGRILLGQRRNRPAQHYWFVPGGRVRKDERLEDALHRIATAELGKPVRDGVLLGVFEHFYEDNALELPGVSTHYVVVGYQCTIADDAIATTDEQHAGFQWWPLDALLRSEAVHDNTKAYFSATPINGFQSRQG